MSSTEEVPLPPFKKRKVQRACDYCRRKKTRCDGPDMRNNRCSNCIDRRAECTYLQEAPKKHRYSRSYVEELESRLERMEKFVGTLVPNTDVDKELDLRDPGRRQQFGVPSEWSHGSGSRSGPSRTSPPLIIPPTPPTSSADNSMPSEDEEVELDQELTEAMRKLSMHSQPFRYHGKSSGLVFIRSALASKNETRTLPPLDRHRHHPWLKDFVEDDFPVFAESVFPARDLLHTLMELYFRRTNCHFPLLHEPMFKNAVKAGKHLRDGGFGATVLLVCAIGARFTRDPRVLLEESNYHSHSAGWKWFRAVEKVRRLSFAPAGLHDLQVYALMAMFLDGSTASVGAWAVVGAGIRAAIEIGVHRKSMYSPTPNVQDELWRRAFWTLVHLEWNLGYGFGRPCSIHDEDYDLAFPTECDDEYWLTPEGKPLFKQPPDKPSIVSGFVHLLKLGQTLAFANRTIYATNKSRAQLGHSDEQWEQGIVSELDSALNQWANSLPSHLRWNPEQENVLFLSQAATIASVYYLHQVAVHRSFMSRASSRRELPISPLSTIICVNASRAAIQVIEVLYNRTGSPMHRNMGMLLMSGILLITHILGLKRAPSGGAVNIEKDLALVAKSIEMLESLQYESHLAELLADTLTNMVSGITEPSPPGAMVNVPGPDTYPRKAETEDARRHERPAPSPDALVHPGEALVTHPGFTLPIPDIPSFPIPFNSDISSIPADNLMQPGAAEAVPLPPPVSQAYPNGVLPAPDSLSPSQSSSTTLSGAAGRTEPRPLGRLGTVPMFGLEAAGTTTTLSDWMPLHPPASAAGERAWRNHPSPSSHDHLSILGDPPGQRDADVSDFMIMDDTLAMWPGMSPVFGWDEWGALFSNADNAGT